MSATYIATASVRHIAVWAAHELQTQSYTTGGWRPLCGRACSRDLTTGKPWTGGTPKETRHQRAIARRPICRDCSRELATMLLALAHDDDGNALELALRKIVDDERAQTMFEAYADSSEGRSARFMRELHK